MSVDLHLHTTASDGTLSPKHIVNKAIEENLEAISITDHDTVDGIDEALENAKEQIEIVPGLEISCLLGNKDVHILGYFINHTDSNLNEKLHNFRLARVDRASKMAKLLQEHNFEISVDDILKEAYPAAPGRAHVARLLVERGYVIDNNEAFAKYLKQGQCCYVPKMGATAKQSLLIIKKAGGLTSLAHYGPSQINDSEVFYLKSLGLDAIEVFHPEHGSKLADKLLKLAQQESLLVTGGSDIHGPRNHHEFKFHHLDTVYLQKLKEKLGLN